MGRQGATVLILSVGKTHPFLALKLERRDANSRQATSYPETSLANETRARAAGETSVYSCVWSQELSSVSLQPGRSGPRLPPRRSQRGRPPTGPRSPSQHLAEGRAVTWGEGGEAMVCLLVQAGPEVYSLESLGGFPEGSSVACSRIMGPWLEMKAVMLGSWASALLLPVGGERSGVC